MKLTYCLLRRLKPNSYKYANLPERYIQRAMDKVYFRSPRGFPQFREIDHKKKNFWFTMNRPWTEEFQRDNNVHHDIPIQPLLEWSFFRGDLVEIMVGPDKGKQGHVNYIVEERNWICVEGLNCKYSTVGKEKDYPGMMVKEEKPLLVTNEVKLVDPSDNKPTDVEWRFLEDGSKIRISTRTGREIPIPLQNEETIDYKTKATYKELSVDFSTWISLIHNLWTKDGLLDDPRCTYYNLCEMAHLAHKKGGQGEYAAALSTIPLSYLLHSRHQAGFISFSSAAGSGYMGENCSTLYTGCDSLGSY